MKSLSRFSRTEILAILFIFDSFSDLEFLLKKLLGYRLVKWCSLSLPIICKWFHSKILIFAQVMGKKLPNLALAPIYGHTIFVNNSAIFCPISKRKISSCTGDQQLQVEHPYAWFRPCLQNLIFLAQKWAWPPRAQYWAPGVRDPIKSSVMCPSFLVNCYLKIEFHKKFRLAPPPLKCIAIANL